LRDTVRGVAWIAAYLLLGVSPLLLSLIDLEPGRGFLINLSVALGFVGLSMMGLQFVLVARFQRVTAPFGIDAVLQFHRQIAFVGMAFILVHPTLLFLDNARFLALLDPLTAPWRARMAVTSTLALLVLVGLSVWRARLRMSYEAWQITHGVLAVVVVAAGLAHALLVGYYTDEPWEKALWIAMSAAFVGLGVWVRLVKPLRHLRHPWRVEEVVPERAGACTVVLRPAGGDRARFRFDPGQFAWLMAGQSPFAITQHPFSISSSAERPDEVTLTIKAAGDFTARIADLRPGETVYLDGPHGSFTIDRHEGPGFVLIGAGVGVTPLMSILRTLADRGDARPCLLLLFNRDAESITFREAIEELESRLSLRVVHVLSDPEEWWEGERGLVHAELLMRHLPERHERLQYFICGPEPMMDAAEAALEEVGVPAERVHSERFGMV
jgi:predicted ferric reductase